MQRHLLRSASFAAFLLVASAGMAAPPPPVCNSWKDALEYFVPNYPGWETAKIIFSGSDGGFSYGRKHTYGTNKFELIKFGNPFSAETFTWDNQYIYITTENMQNNTPHTRVWQPGYLGYYLGASWMPRIVCTSGNQTYRNLNRFFLCHNGVKHYEGCNSCPCQQVSTEPARCLALQWTVSHVNYNYGGSIGTLPTLILQAPFDDMSGTEWYYYGLGRGFLRFEVRDFSGLQLLSYGWQSGEIPNDPIPAQACFHP